MNKKEDKIMKIENKLEKEIGAIVCLTGEYPKEIEITKEEYEQIKTDVF